MNKIEIFNETNEEIKELKELKKILKYACDIEEVKNAQFNIIIVNNDKIRELNRDYRNKDSVTDVITFALEDFEDFKYNDFRLLGDIYISLDKCKEQSISYEHSFKRELFFLAIHGFLHLLGYDHMDKNDEKVMFEKQDIILNGYGVTR